MRTVLHLHYMLKISVLNRYKGHDKVNIMSEDYTLALSQIAQILNKDKVDIAESTVRKYAKLYKEFLPSRKLEGVRWEKYLPSAIAIIKRIFILSEQGKNRHEIKICLKAEGYTVTLDGEAQDTNDTPTESTQKYTDTPVAASSSTSENTVLIQTRHSEMVASHLSYVTQSAIDSLKMYRSLMEDKNIQIGELRKKIATLEKEKGIIQTKWQREMLSVLDDVAEFKQQSVKTIKALKQQKLESS